MRDSNKQSAAVFVHGFLGGPQQFDFLMPVAEQCGFDAYALLLPGHGGDYRAFFKSGRISWERYVQSKLDELRGQYENILLVTHSMGGLLSICAALADARSICGIFAIALPLNLRVSKKGMQTNWKHVTGIGREDDYTRAARSFSSVTGITIWNAPLMLPRVLDLVKLSAAARHKLGSLRVPLAILHSEQDEWVGARSVQTAKHCAHTPPSITVLSESGHFFYTEADKQKISGHFSAFASACLTQE